MKKQIQLLLNNLESASEMTVYWRFKCTFLEGVGGDIKIRASLNKLASRFCHPYLRLSQQANSRTLLKFAYVMTGFSSSLDFVQRK